MKIQNKLKEFKEMIEILKVQIQIRKMSEWSDWRKGEFEKRSNRPQEKIGNKRKNYLRNKNETKKNINKHNR